MADNGAPGAQLTSLERALRKNTMQMERLLAHQVWSALGEEKVLTFPYQNLEISFHLPEGWFDLLQRIILLNRKFYEVPLLENIRARLGPRPVIADIGANIGNHSVFFAKVCKAEHVHAFEPIPHIQKILRRNTELNAMSGFTLYPFALGEAKGNIGVDMFNPANLGSTTLAPGRDGQIPIKTLDSLELDGLSLLKIDVEGMQDAVLRGASNTIRESRPILVIEAFKKNQERAKTTALLGEMGYAVDQIIGHNIIARPAAHS